MKNQKELLGSKYIGGGTVIIDTITNTPYEVEEVKQDGYELKPRKAVGKTSETVFIPFDELLIKFDKGHISIGGYDHTEPDKLILHNFIQTQMQGNELGSLNNKVDDLTTEDVEFKSGGMIGNVQVSKSGIVKEIRNKHGKIIKQVDIEGKIYVKKNGSYSYNDGDKLTKNDIPKIEIFKKGGKAKSNSEKKEEKVDSAIVDRIVNKEVYANQDALVRKLLQDGVISYDEIENAYTTESEEAEPQPQEIHEWWLISDWLADKLNAQGAPIIKSDYGTWWGRTTTGQQISQDSIIQNVASENYKKGGKVKSKPITTAEVAKPEGYNGWRNYETWAAKLWIDNDGGSQGYWNERADALLKDNSPDDAKYELSQELKDYFEEENPLSDKPSMYSDLLQNALNRVDWYEIAENLLSDKISEKSEPEEEMKEGGKVDVTKNYYRFRQHSPENVTECAVPAWAKKVAESVKEGAKIVTCKKKGEWTVQSVLIPRDGIKSKEAKQYAQDIMDKIETRKKALGGRAESANCEDINKTIKGLEALIEVTKNKDKKEQYEQILKDLKS